MTSTLRRLATLVALGTLMSCGGGGGGDSSSSVTGLGLANVRSAGTTQRAYDDDTPLGGVTIVADVRGDLSRLAGKTVYVIIEDPDQLFETTPRVLITPNGIENRIELAGRSMRGRAGVYFGPLRVNVCLDAACRQPFDGSPIVLPLAIEVLPGPRFGVASPLVVSLPFGSPETEVAIPVVVPAGTTGWSGTLTPAAGSAPLPFSLEWNPQGTAKILRVPRIRVGSWSASVDIEATAQYDGRIWFLHASLPVTVEVTPVAGTSFVWTPASLSLQGLTTGAFVDGSQQFTELLAADGTLYTGTARVEYLPAGPDGNLDAGGIAWLEAGVATPPGGNTVTTMMSALSLPCGQPSPDRRCLAPGRYDALVYARTPAGAEAALPLRVSLTVRPG